MCSHALQKYSPDKTKKKRRHMTGTRTIRKSILFIAGLFLSMAGIGGCEGGDGVEPGAPPQTGEDIEVRASVLEGRVPLTVDFTVSGEFINSVNWDFGDGSTAQTTGTDSISHTFTEAGPSTVIASVVAQSTFIDTQTFIFQIPVNVIPDVNLIVQSFAIDTEVTPGDWETVSAIIQNVGASPLTGSGHIDIGYYLSTDNVITVDDILIGDTSVVIGDAFVQAEVPFGFEQLSPGENYQYDHQLAVKNNIPAGTYFAGAIVDYIDYYEWYTFPRATDSKEYAFPEHVTVDETDETDNVRVLPAYQVTVNRPVCTDDVFEPDDSTATATPISIGETQARNFCFDNSDWLRFDAVQGGVYKILTSGLGLEADTQLILYDRDGESILLFHDNIGNDDDDSASPPSSCPPAQTNDTVDLECGWPEIPRSEIVWEAQSTGTYFIKVRTTTCDEDKDEYCESTQSFFSPEGIGSPDGVGLDTEYSITLQ